MKPAHEVIGEVLLERALLFPAPFVRQLDRDFGDVPGLVGVLPYPVDVVVDPLDPRNVVLVDFVFDFQAKFAQKQLAASQVLMLTQTLDVLFF